MRDLINRLRCAPLWNGSTLHAKAADALEAQAKEIDELKVNNNALKDVVSFEKSRSADYKAICDQMGDALVIVAAYLPLSKVPSAQVALAAWREIKCS